MAERLKVAYKPDELMAKIEEYFDTTDPKYQTRAGLCVFLGITKMTFINYKNGTQGDEIREACEWACTRLENKYEVDLNLRPNPTGPIFALKQYGWRDNQDVDVKASGFEIICNVPRPEESKKSSCIWRIPEQFSTIYIGRKSMKEQIVLKYEPNSRQAEFHKSGEDYVVYGGARGGGKTCALVWEAFMWGMEHPGANMFIFRETYTALEQNVIREWKESIPQELYRYNESKHIAKLINGTTVSFSFVSNEDDARRYQGSNIDWIGIDELTKHTEKEVQLLLTCLRSAKGFRPKFRGTCNPGGVGHLWVKDTYIIPTKYGKEVIEDKTYGIKIKFIPATVYDNEVLMKNDPAYVKRLENLPENEKQAFLYGNWDIFEGRFFGEWSETTHVIAPFEIPKEWKKYVSIDWGYKDYCDVLWHAVDGLHIYTYRELHVKETSVRDVAYTIKSLMTYDEKIEYWVGSPDMWQTRGTGDTVHGENIADIFANERIYWQKAENSRLIGWQVMREAMLKAEDGKPRWLIFSSCKNIIRCLPLAQYDDKNIEDMSTEPHEITDALDSARYFLISRPSARKHEARLDTKNYTPTEIEDFLGKKQQVERRHDSVDRRRVWRR